MLRFKSYDMTDLCRVDDYSVQVPVASGSTGSLPSYRPPTVPPSAPVNRPLLRVHLPVGFFPSAAPPPDFPRWAFRRTIVAAAPPAHLAGDIGPSPVSPPPQERQTPSRRRRRSCLRGSANPARTRAAQGYQIKWGYR